MGGSEKSTAGGLTRRPSASPPAEGLELFGTSAPICALYDLMRRCATSSAPVLILGSSGTGKESAARAIHRRSTRANRPFVAVECATLSGTLLDRELFGTADRTLENSGYGTGAIAAANTGTLFLNGVGEIPLDVQRRLARCLDSRSCELDVRVISATQVPIERAMREGRFLSHLYYILNVLPIEMPALRARREDIMPIAFAALREIDQGNGAITRSFTQAAVAAMESYAWPGNVRELLAVLRRAVVFASAATIDVADLGLKQAGDVTAIDRPRGSIARNGAEPRSPDRIRDALARNGFNVKRTAEALALSRVTLYRLIERHGIALTRRPKAAN